MRAGTAGLAEGRDPHLLDAMEILHDAWNKMEVTTIAHCWAKAQILDVSTQTDIVAEHGSRSRCPVSEETQASIDSILFGLKILELENDRSKDDALMDSVHGTLDLFHVSKSPDDFINNLNTWVEIEETEEFKEMIQQEKEECFNEYYIIQQILTKTSGITKDLPDKEEKKIIDEQVKALEVDIVHVRNLLRMEDILQL